MLVNERCSAPCYRPQTLASNLAKSPDLEQQLIMGVVTHGTLHKLHLAAVLGQFFEEDHLMDIVTRSPIRGGEQKPLERTQGGAIA